MSKSLPLPKSSQFGFTIVELIVMIVIIGIIAVLALPRFADRSDFQARGFQDETRSLLRYAQKAAVAQRRNVCVTLGGTGVTMTIDNSTPANGVCDIAPAPSCRSEGGTPVYVFYVTSTATAGGAIGTLGRAERMAALLSSSSRSAANSAHAGLEGASRST
jgi:MSHA pilin protein MshC